MKFPTNITDTNTHVPKLVCCGSEQMSWGFSEKRSVTQTDKQTSPEIPHAAWPEVACANTQIQTHQHIEKYGISPYVLEMSVDTLCHISEWVIKMDVIL